MNSQKRLLIARMTSDGGKGPSKDHSFGYLGVCKCLGSTVTCTPNQLDTWVCVFRKYTDMHTELGPEYSRVFGFDCYFLNVNVTAE